MLPTFLRDPCCRQLDTRVLACRPQDDGFLAITPDTPLFPGGGGQPEDHGTLAGQSVLAVTRDADGGWVHRIPAAVPVGPVRIELDWARRYDHMQQHSAQHLITALAQDRLGLATTAFHLGVDRASVDLAADPIPAEALGTLDALVQEAIRAALSVGSRHVQPEELASLAVRSRGLPEGHRGLVRLVEIEGVDRNTCGGTHVASTAELQLVVFTGTERVHGGCTRLHYLAGGRALALVAAAMERERAITRLLTCGPEEHVTATERLLVAQRDQARELRGLRGELAEALGAALVARAQGALLTLHRDEDDLPFLQAVARSALALRPEALLVLTGGAPQGCFLLAGPEAEVARLGPVLLPVIEGRGGGARGRFQGKAARLDQREAAAEVLRGALAEPA